MQKGTVLLLLALLIALPAFAQEVGSVSGTVSTEDGNPVAGAGVTIFNDNRDVFQTRTDREGAFAFERIPAGDWVITASFERMNVEDNIRVVANENTEIDLILGGNGGGGDDGVGSVSGTVFNQQREAVAGAAVTIMSDRREVVGETETDDNGAFSFEEIDAGGYEISAELGELRASEEIRVADGENTEVRLVLAEEGGGDDGVGSVSGFVFNEQREAVSQATITLYNERREVAGRAVTDENGTFLIEDVPAGGYTIIAALGEERASEEIRIAEDQVTEVRLVLSAGGGEGEGGRVFGIVSDPNGDPVVRAIVHLWSDARERPFVVARAVTDENGSYRLGGPAGVYHITTEVEEVGVAEADVEIIAGERIEVNLVLGEGQIGEGYGVEDEDMNLPENHILLSSYPNPFNAVATVDYTLFTAGIVNLSVFNTAGQQIQTLVESYHAAGVHQTSFNGKSLPVGTYILRLETAGQTQMQKVLLLK